MGAPYGDTDTRAERERADLKIHSRVQARRRFEATGRAVRGRSLGIVENVRREPWIALDFLAQRHNAAHLEAAIVDARSDVDE
jgi:hypothetical protein